jgi:uncharacterized protein DUF1194
LKPITNCKDARAEAEIDLALVLAVDVLLFIEPDEQELQRQGFIKASQHPVVYDVICNGMLGRVVVTYIERAGAWHQKVIVPWTVVETPADGIRFATRLSQSPTNRAGYTPSSGAMTSVSGSGSGQQTRCLQ